MFIQPRLSHFITWLRCGGGVLVLRMLYVPLPCILPALPVSSAAPCGNRSFIPACPAPRRALAFAINSQPSQADPGVKVSRLRGRWWCLLPIRRVLPPKLHAPFSHHTLLLSCLGPQAPLRGSSPSYVIRFLAATQATGSACCLGSKWNEQLSAVFTFMWCCLPDDALAQLLPQLC